MVKKNKGKEDRINVNAEIEEVRSSDSDVLHKQKQTLIEIEKVRSSGFAENKEVFRSSDATDRTSSPSLC